MMMSVFYDLYAYYIKYGLVYGLRTPLPLLSPTHLYNEISNMSL